MRLQKLSWFKNSREKKKQCTGKARRGLEVGRGEGRRNDGLQGSSWMNKRNYCLMDMTLKQKFQKNSLSRKWWCSHNTMNGCQLSCDILLFVLITHNEANLTHSYSFYKYCLYDVLISVVDAGEYDNSRGRLYTLTPKLYGYTQKYFMVCLKCNYSFAYLEMSSVIRIYSFIVS